MAKVVKDDRTVMDVDSELAKIKKETNSSSKKEEKKQKDKNTKKNSSKKKKAKNSKKHSHIFLFFKEVKSEMSKVKWPSKKDMVKYSVATITFIVFFALFFYLIDFIVALLKAGV